jgi:hypothetical protein
VVRNDNEIMGIAAALSRARARAFFSVHLRTYDYGRPHLIIPHTLGAAPGWGTLLDAAPARLGPAGSDRQARRSYAAVVNEVSVVEFYPALRVNGRG